MREGSRIEKNEQLVGNVLLSSQSTTCMGPFGGAASSDSMRFCSNFASFRLIRPFVLSWSIEAGSDPRGHLWVTWGVLKKVPTRTGPRCAPSACNPCRFAPDQRLHCSKSKVPNPKI